MKRALCALVLSLVVWGCSTISTHDVQSYTNVVNLKVDSLELMALGVNPPDEYANRIDELRIALRKAYEYETGRPSNVITIAQWDVLVDPNGSSIGKFLNQWPASDRGYNPVFLDEWVLIVSDHFDEIKKLEGAKLR